MTTTTDHQATAQARTHDYGPGYRCWGHDYTFEPGFDGQHARMTGWGTGIGEGDYLLIEQPDADDRRTRYRVDSIRYSANPADMWFAEVTFAPREPARCMTS